MRKTKLSIQPPLPLCEDMLEEVGGEYFQLIFDDNDTNGKICAVALELGKAETETKGNGILLSSKQ